MTLIDALAALQEGAVPTNEQSVEFLRRFKTVLPQKDDLSKPGAKLVGSSGRVVEAVQRLIEQRNTNEELQEFLWRTHGVGAQGTTVKQKGGFKVKFGKGAESAKEKKGGKQKSVKNEKTSVKEDAVQAGKHLQTLVRLALIQPELRHIAADLGYVFAQAVDKTAQQTIDRSQEQLGQVKSATGTFQNVAQKALLQARAQREVQQQTQEQGATLTTSARRPLPASMALLREQTSALFTKGNLNIDTLRQELQNGQTVPKIVEEVRKQAIASALVVASGDEEELDRLRDQIEHDKIPAKVLNAMQLNEEGVKGDGSITVNGDAQRADGALTATDLMDAIQMLAVANKKLHLAPSREQITQMANQARKDATSNLKESFDDDVQQRLLNRSRKLVVDCQSSDDYKQAVIWLIERVEALFQSVQKHISVSDTSIAKLDKALSYNAEPLIQLLENFAGQRAIRHLLELARELSIGAKDDEQVRTFWCDADAHLRKCLLEEGFILLPEAEQEFKELLERFKGLQEAYREKLGSFVQGCADVINAIRKDEIVLQLSQALKDMLSGLKGEGWKAKQLLHDLRHKILPPLFEKFGVIPVPRIKYLHPDFDLVIENIALELTTLLPDTLDFQMKNDVHLDFRKIKSSTHAHQFKIKLKGMSLRIHKLAFAFTSRLGGIKFHDHGIADLAVKDFGVSMYISVPTNPGPHYFLVDKVKVKLRALKIAVHKSNHPVLHFLADKLANSYLTKRILRHFIAQGITLGLKQLDVQLMALRLKSDGEKGDISMAEVKRQMAELRDLLKKYHEQAGTIEIDFTRDGEQIGGTTLTEKAKAAGKSIEESHAVRWVKKQVDETGQKEIVRNAWRSNAFDMSGMDTVRPVHADEAPRPEGETDDSTVTKARAELDLAKAEAKEERAEVQRPEGMESIAGKEAVQSDNDRSEQAKKLESAVDKHPTTI